MVVPLLCWTSHTLPPVNDDTLQPIALVPAYQTDWPLFDQVPVIEFHMLGVE